MGLLSCLLIAGAAAVAMARPGAADAGDETVVARVGQRTITVGELERRLSTVPLFQLRVLGETPDEIRRAYLNQLIEEELLVQAARSEQVHHHPAVRGALRALLRRALLEQVRLQAGDGKDVSAEEVAAYFEAHAESYRSEKLLKLWQIVVPSRDQAAKVLSTIRNDPAYREDPLQGWADLVEKHSIDLSTKKNRGDLGFVRKDGQTKRPNVRVDPALFAAAEKVADGEVVPEPVQVGKNFVVVQRRGTREPQQRTVETEAPAIRRKLAQARYQKRVSELTAELRKGGVLEHHPERVDMLEVTVPYGDIVTKGRPGGLERSRHPSAGSPRPAGLPGRLR